MNLGISDSLKIYEDAAFYDEEFQNRTHDLDFFVKLAKRNGGPILELGCGSGRITIPIAQQGLEIHGIDISPPMLQRGIIKGSSLNNNLHFHLMDMADFQLKLKVKFKFIFAASNSLQHLYSDDEVRSCLKSIHSSLDQGGLCVLDIANPDWKKLNRKWEEKYLFKTIMNSEYGKLDVYARSEYIASSKTLHFELEYKNIKNEVVKLKDVKMRCFFPNDLEELCADSGLEIIHKSGNYDRYRFHEHSPKQIVYVVPRPP